MSSSFPPLSNIVCSARMGQLGVTVCWFIVPNRQYILHTANSGKEKFSKQVSSLFVVR